MQFPVFPTAFRKRCFLLSGGIFVLLLLFSLPLRGQLSGGGEANPDLHTNRAMLERWQSSRFGMFIHWGPVTLRGTEIGWSRGTSVPVTDYDSLYKEFNPVLFDADEWVRIASGAGMKYMVLVTKHHDGFCLWPSDPTGYDIAATPYGKDIVGPLAEACRGKGLLFGTYYSILDWWHPLYPLSHGNAPKDTAKTDMTKYTEYLYRQVDELLTRYHPDILWFDGQWEKPWTHEAGMTLYAHIRNIRDDILINNRVDKGKVSGSPDAARYAGDFLTPEQTIGRYDLKNPWESCMTIGTQWSWKPNDRIRSRHEILEMLARSAGGNGNLLLNVSPMPDGRIERRVQKRLAEVGEWLERYGHAIYGTRGGPWPPDSLLASTRDDEHIYLLLYGQGNDQVDLPYPAKAKIRQVSWLNGPTLPWKKENGRLKITLEGPFPDPDVSVVAIRLKE